MRVAIVGAGAIGGFIAAALARSEVEVGVVARGAHLEAIRREGLHVESDLGVFHASVNAADDLRELGALDIVILSFKSHQWPALREQIDALAETPAQIVTLQNGVPFWYVRDPPLRSVDPQGHVGRHFGDDRIVGGVVHVSGTIVEPGRIRQSGGLRYVFGDPRGGTGARVDALVDLFRRAGLAAEADPDVRATVWLKLVNNAGLNPISVLRRMTIKPMLENPQARAEVRELMEEALAVGQAMGVVAEVDVDARIAYAARLEDVKTSMLQDFERERPLELDPILGAVIELAGRYAVAVPRARAAYEKLANLVA